MAEKRDIEINSRADTIGLMDMDVRPYPVTLEVTGTEALMDIIDFDITWYGFNASIKGRSGGWVTSLPPLCSAKPVPSAFPLNRPPAIR
ncbi:MAG: hypothetical protein P8017_10025 [Deltaproteobacteria bacterium]